MPGTKIAGTNALAVFGPQTGLRASACRGSGVLDRRVERGLERQERPVEQTQCRGGAWSGGGLAVWLFFHSSPSWLFFFFPKSISDAWVQSRLVASAGGERGKAYVVGDGRWRWRWTGLGREEGREGRGRGRKGGEGREGKEGRGRKGGSETGGAWVGTGLGREQMEGSEMGGAWVGTRRWRGARRKAHGWRGKMEGSETGGARVGTGLGREDGGELDWRRMGGDGVGEGRWRGARPEARGWGGTGEGRWELARVTSITLGQCKSRTKHGWG